jgi:hypothetical protein
MVWGRFYLHSLSMNQWNLSQGNSGTLSELSRKTRRKKEEGRKKKEEVYFGAKS